MYKLYYYNIKKGRCLEVVAHKEFNYCSLEQINDEIKSLGLDLHLSNSIELLKRTVEIDNFIIPNSMAVHPMEGCDGEADGSPGELTIRRYERFARGGAGLIWFEAVAVVPEGKANPRQLMIDRNNISKFQKLYQLMTDNARSVYGDGFRQVFIMQLTHSGRYSKPEGKSAPIIACHNPYLDAAQKIDEGLPVISDDDLERLEDEYVKSALLAKEAGFQGVDVKCCHRYLNSELLSCFTRKGRYGGTFEGRTRFLLNIIDKIRDRLGKGFIVTTRMNSYDAIPYPYGWGTDKQDHAKYDMTEPIELVKLLYKRGVRLVNLTMGNPYYNPHVNRPFDKGPYVPQEHPLFGVARLITGIGEVQKAVPEMAVIGTGYSWLRQFSANLAAGTLEKGLASIIGFGRESFAYPDFPRDIAENGFMVKDKCCIACGKCSEIMRAGGTPGCVIRDSKLYAPVYKQFAAK